MVSKDISGDVPTLYVYLLTQSVIYGYDTYKSCVVIAIDEEEARLIHPEGYTDAFNYSSGWVSLEHIHSIKVTKLGIATTNQVAGTVVCASYN